MKPITISELDEIVAQLQTLVGARLQEIVSSRSILGLGLWLQRHIIWLWIDMNPVAPVILIFRDTPPQLTKKVTPVQLFLRAHGLSTTLKSVQRQKQFGRILEFQFEGGEDKRCRLEIRLFPHGQNIILNSGSLKISWEKVEAITSQAESSETGQTIRTLHEIVDQWKKSNEKKRVTDSTEKKIDQLIEKKRRTLLKAQEDLEAKEQVRWREAGVWLKTHRSVQVPNEFLQYVKSDHSLIWNIENCFQKAKELDKKKQKSRQNVQSLEEELKALNSNRDLAGQFVQEKRDDATNVLKQNDLRGYHLAVRPGVVAYLGKSAKDNLLLLRKAQPWDFWLHLRDYPGAHCIIRRGRAEILTPAELNKIASWLVKGHLRKKTASQGVAFDVVYVECRYVRPIKGDRLGRVHYSNEKVIRVLANIA